MSLKNIFLAVLTALITVCLIFEIIIYSGYKRLCRDINFGSSKFELLKTEFDYFAHYYKYQTEYSSDAFNYLAIGNSITLTPEFGHGMCSTKPDNDYFNLVQKSLLKNHPKVIAYPYNFAVWERSNNREETLCLLDTYLDKKLNLVSIQLGENVQDITTLEQDFIHLINYVKDKAPNAKVIIVGDFWNKDVNAIRKKSAEISGCDFVDISAIIGNKNFQSKEGTVSMRQNGSKCIVTKDMSTHPGDTGMEYIAQEILKHLN